MKSLEQIISNEKIKITSTRKSFNILKPLYDM